MSIELEAIEDNNGVDSFADDMKAKLAISRSKGRHGWWDENICSVELLKELLETHIAKGDLVDIANFCMMLKRRGVDYVRIEIAKAAEQPSYAGGSHVDNSGLVATPPAPSQQPVDYPGYDALDQQAKAAYHKGYERGVADGKPERESK